jgi:plasmid stabilization system protein ParE
LARVIVTPRAVEDLTRLIESLGLPPSTLRRVQRSLRVLERFPLAGRALHGRWQGKRVLIGPWPWMIMVYVHDGDDDVVYIVAVHDGRSSTAASHER